MKSKLGSEPVFPTVNDPETAGVTKRELFSAMMMQGFCSNSNYHIQADEYYVMRAKHAVAHADALLEELEKGQR